MALSSALYTMISPVRTGAVPMLRNRMSPRKNDGSILPLSTTTTGDSEPVANMRVFQDIRADVTIIAAHKVSD